MKLPNFKVGCGIQCRCVLLVWHVRNGHTETEPGIIADTRSIASAVHSAPAIPEYSLSTKCYVREAQTVHWVVILKIGGLIQMFCLAEVLVITLQ